jgi:hypothetical protein
MIVTLKYLYFLHLLMMILVSNDELLACEESPIEKYYSFFILLIKFYILIELAFFSKFVVYKYYAFIRAYCHNKSDRASFDDKYVKKYNYNHM